MKITTWNCRGIGKKTFWMDVESFCKIERIQLIALFETRTNKEPSEKVWKKTRFDQFYYIPAMGFLGGICVMWKTYQLTNEILEIDQIDTRFISVKYTNQISNKKLMLILTYAPPNEARKNVFWNGLTSYIKNCSLPCIVMGDLNEIQDPSEKLGGLLPPLTKFARLRHFKNECELIDTPIQGNGYTWRKNTTEIDNIYENWIGYSSITRSFNGTRISVPNILLLQAQTTVPYLLIWTQKHLLKISRSNLRMYG